MWLALSLGSSVLHCDLTVKSMFSQCVPLNSQTECQKETVPVNPSMGNHQRSGTSLNGSARSGSWKWLFEWFWVFGSWELFLFEMQIYQSWLDKSTPFSAVRWAVTLILTAIYMIRVYILQVQLLLLFRNIHKMHLLWHYGYSYHAVVDSLECNLWIFLLQNANRMTLLSFIRGGT